MQQNIETMRMAHTMDTEPLFLISKSEISGQRLGMTNHFILLQDESYALPYLWDMDPNCWTGEQNQISRDEMLLLILNISYGDHTSSEAVHNRLNATADPLKELLTSVK